MRRLPEVPVHYSMGNKHKELETSVQDCDLAGVTETGCDGLHRYNGEIELFRKHGPGRCRGGVAICIRAQLAHTGSAWGWMMSQVTWEERKPWLSMQRHG